jgi:hypothetical protein
MVHCKENINLVKKKYSLFISIRVRTQDPVLARQVFYHISHALSPEEGILSIFICASQRQ